MDDLISRQMAISEIVGMTTMGIEELVIAGDKEKYDWIKGLSDSLVRIINLPSAESNSDRYKQGVIEGRVQMRTELLAKLKEIVGEEIWTNI